MAKVKPRKPSKAPITEFPTPEASDDAPSAIGVEDPPEDEAEAPPPIATESQASPPSRGPGRPPGRPDPLPKIQTFFQTLASIPTADWGTRAKVRVYRLKPVYDMLIGSTRKYITIYEEPPVNEEVIKRDCGSGRYRLYLNFKSAGERKDKEIDSVEIDILDPRFPPNLPVGPWLDESVNREWRWARPLLEAREAKTQQANAPTSESSNMLDAIRVFGEIQDRAEERTKERAEASRPQTWDPAQQLATVVTAAKDIAGALKATPENPIPAFISEQMTAMRAELTAQRARSDALMDRLLDNAKAPQQQNGALSTIKELVGGIKELLPELQGLFPKADEAIAGRMGRSRMGGWQEFFQPVLPGLVQALAPLVPVIASRVASTGGPPPPPSFTRVANAPPQASLPSAPQQPEPNLDAMLLNALGNERTGGDFADSILTLFGPLLYRQICSLGEAGMLAMLQQRPVWGQLGALQAKMPEFIHEFVSYGEEGGPDDEPPAPGANAEQPPIDLVAEVESASTAGGMA